MRINTFYYFIFFTCFTCVSCAQTTVNQCVVEKVEVDMKTLCNCSLSDISSDVTFLKLENNSSSFIQQVSKWVAFDHKIYIADKKQKRIFIFDSRGKYLNVIGQFGRGETEIFEFADFTIDVYNGKIIILDTGNKKLLYYTTDGVFLETQRFSQVWNITSLNKDLYAVYYAQRKKFDIDILSKNGNVINQYLPIEDCLIDNKVSFNMHYFSKNHLGETMLLPYLSSIAYKVTPDSIIPKYSFDFGINTLPQDFFVDAFSEISNIKSSKMRYDLRQKTWNEVYQKKYVYATSSFKESYNYLYFQHSCNRRVFSALVSKKNNFKVKNIGRWTLDKDYHAPINFYCCELQNDTLSGFVDVIRILKSYKSLTEEEKQEVLNDIPNLKPIVEDSTPMDNPILVKIKLNKEW